MIIYLSQKLRL